MSSNFDRDIERAMRGRLAATTLRMIEGDLADMEARVDRRMMAALRLARALDPDVAVQAWYEKFAIANLRDRLMQQERAGQSAGTRITPHMETTNAA